MASRPRPDFGPLLAGVSQELKRAGRATLKMRGPWLTGRGRNSIGFTSSAGLRSSRPFRAGNASGSRFGSCGRNAGFDAMMNLLRVSSTVWGAAWTSLKRWFDYAGCGDNSSSAAREQAGGAATR